MSGEDTTRDVDRFNLERFVKAQEPVFQQVTSELRAGRKTSHWMWFIFPQIRGLGHSPTAVEYSILGIDEARAYLAHPVLGPRLKQCTELVLGIKDRSATQIFGPPDDMKFRSCMTLFTQASPEIDAFAGALRKYFSGIPDRMTLDRL